MPNMQQHAPGAMHQGGQGSRQQVPKLFFFFFPVSCNDVKEYNDVAEYVMTQAVAIRTYGNVWQTVLDFDFIMLPLDGKGPSGKFPGSSRTMQVGMPGMPMGMPSSPDRYVFVPTLVSRQAMSSCI